MSTSKGTPGWVSSFSQEDLRWWFFRGIAMKGSATQEWWIGRTQFHFHICKTFCMNESWSGLSWYVFTTCRYPSEIRVTSPPIAAVWSYCFWTNQEASCFSKKIWPYLEVKIPKTCKTYHPTTYSGTSLDSTPVHLASLGWAKLHLFAASNMFLEGASNMKLRHLLVLSRWSTRKGLFTFKVETTQTIRKKRSRQKYCILVLASCFGKKVPLWQAKLKFQESSVKIFQRFSDTNSNNFQLAKSHQASVWHLCRIALVVWIVWLKPWRSNWLPRR